MAGEGEGYDSENDEVGSSCEVCKQELAMSHALLSDAYQ